MLISVHLPKTAGVSFLSAIESRLDGRLLRDYADMPLNSGNLKRNWQAAVSCVRNIGGRRRFGDVECIHGHFLPLKYLLLPTARRKTFVCWLRDPVNRLVSHYYYWQREFDPATAGDLHRRVVEEAWTLERFCTSPELKNTYSKFFWGFPLRRFDFIGITEHYAEELDYFGRYLLEAELPLEPINENTNPAKPAGHYINDPDLRTSIEKYHSTDMQIYRHALGLRAKRIAGPS